MAKNNQKKSKPKKKHTGTEERKYAAPLTTFTSAEFDEIHEADDDEKPVRISLHLIAKRHLPHDASTWDHDKILSELNKISHARLDRERIYKIDNMELLSPKVTNLYLQMNKIQRIEGLECLKDLRFLTLANNNINKVENLTALKQLTFLDLSENKIESFDIDEFPQSLSILNLTGNPCTNIPDYRGRIIQDLANLKMLDGEWVSKTERLEAGYKVSSGEDEEEEADDDTAEDRGAPIDGYIQELANGILLRSQSRVDNYHDEHRRRLHELDSFRDRHILSPSPRYESKSTVKSLVK